jgi:hypothetical protein
MFKLAFAASSKVVWIIKINTSWTKDVIKVKPTAIVG